MTEKELHPYKPIAKALLLLGLAAFIALLSLGVLRYANMQSMEKITGRVVDVDTYEDETSYTVVEYEIDGETYTKTFYVFASWVHPGDDITLYRTSENPLDVDCFINGLFTPFLLCFFALILALTGLGLLLPDRLAKKKLARLKESGTSIRASVLSVEMNANMNVGRHHPFRIICQANDPVTGETHYYRSKNLWYYPEPILERLQIETLLVYVNPEKKRDYIVDTSSLERAGYTPVDE